MAFESVNPGDATKPVACDNVAGDYVQVVKQAFGADGVATMVDATNRLPVAATVSGTVPVSGSVAVSSVPASTRTTDAVAAAPVSDALMVGLVACTPKFTFANVAAATTDASIVAAVGGKRIRVIAARVNTSGTATNVTFNSKPAGAGTAITETLQLDARVPWATGYNPHGQFQSGVGEGLTVTTGAGSQVGVGVVYIEV